MDFINNWHGNNCIALIDENDVEVSYTKLYIDVCNALEEFPSFKSLVFLQVRNDYASIVSYLACVLAKHPVLLLEADLSLDLISDLNVCYKPNVHISIDGIQIIHDQKLDLHEELCLLLSTSGSTGSPKLVRLSFENVFTNATAIAEYLGLSDKDSAITTLPMSYSFGLSIINSHLLSGVNASIVLSNHSVVSREFWEIVNRHQVSSFSGVPYLFQILKKMKYDRFDTSSIRYLTQAGGRLDSETTQYFSKMCKDRKQDFIVMYGQTEAAPRISYLPSAMLDHKLGSIGIPIPNGRLKIVDVDGLDVLDADVIGEIVYQGPNVMMGYAQVVSDLALPCSTNGTLSTGDLGFFDADGYFFVTGRLKRFIKVYGLRVGLDEIENWLLKSDVESAATGFDDNLLVYILDSTVNIDLLKTKIATEFKFNIRAISVSLIDGFPRSANGKIDYASLPISIHGGGL